MGGEETQQPGCPSLFWTLVSCILSCICSRLSLSRPSAFFLHFRRCLTTLLSPQFDFLVFFPLSYCFFLFFLPFTHLSFFSLSTFHNSLFVTTMSSLIFFARWDVPSFGRLLDSLLAADRIMSDVRTFTSTHSLQHTHHHVSGDPDARSNRRALILNGFAVVGYPKARRQVSDEFSSLGLFYQVQCIMEPFVLPFSG
jgi:hypothetical protein